MRKWYFYALSLLFANQLFAQQDAALAPPTGAIIAPTSGCALTAAEVVTVRIFNFGPGAITTDFDLSYSITGPVNSAATETVLSPNIPANSSFTYSFVTTANLSVPGAYSLDATVILAGDPNTSNNTYSGHAITHIAPSNGGAANGGTNVCISGNSGNITLSGQIGNVLNWEYSTDGGSTWFNISNTSTTQPYNDLIVETWYRANVQNAGCPSATSSIAVMTIDPVTVGGSTSGSPTSVCSGTNSGNVTLSGHTGAVQHWEFSDNGGVTWNIIANTTNTQSFSNLTVTTRYRARVQSGACVGQYSSQTIITVSPPTVAGIVTDDATVCSGSNSGTLTLSGHVGSVVRWQYSINGGASWVNIANTTTTQNYTNLTQTRLYRAQVRSGACPQLNSAEATITVVTSSFGGVLSASNTVCYGSNEDTLRVTGQTGDIINWEFSTDNGSTWNTIVNTTDSLVYTNLIETTRYRVAVQSGLCPVGYSTQAIITVDTLTNGGMLSGATTVCASGNNGTVTLASYNGTVIEWEFSQDNGLTWSTIVNTSNNQNYSNLTTTTLYRVLSQNGVCPGGYSDTLQITVDSLSLGGNVMSNVTVCSGDNNGTLTLAGERGSVLNWESSTDGGFTWINIVNNTTLQVYNNITQSTQYRALVRNGLCVPNYSTPASVVVDAQPIGGNIIGSTTVCEGVNSGVLNLVGFSTTVNSWESSTDGGATWNPIVNATAVETYSNLTQTTLYRAITQNGVCPNDTSTVATITVDALTVGGAVSANDTVCAGANNGILVLVGETGSVLSWELSNDGGVSWITLANTTTSQGYLNLMTTTTYRALVRNGVCPAVGSDPITITVNQQSVGGSVSSNATVCAGNNFGVLSLFGSTGSVVQWESSTDFGNTWNPIANSTFNETYSNLTDTTWYRVIVQNGICGADTSSIAFINLYPQPIASFTVDTVCFGQPSVFVNNSTTSSGFISLNNWSFGDGNNSISNNPVYTYSTAGSYAAQLYVQNNFGCMDTLSVFAAVLNSPEVVITPMSSLAFCDGDSVVLQTIEEASYIYDWNDGSTSFETTAFSNGYYAVVVEDITTGCLATDSVEVVVYPLPAADAGLDTTISLGTSVQLFGTGGVAYSWSPSDDLSNPFINNPFASPPTTTDFVLTVTNSNGCSATDTVRVSVENDYFLIIHNLLTPNGDGFNDAWIIENIENYPENEVSIFNRQGQLIYRQQAYDNTWEGTFNGKNLPDGAYYYVITFTDTDKIFKGAVNIIRSSK
ncbi:MAG: gliding motility-associated C-terminal domain-containing protein [Flavobacteriales bacterium]